MSKEQIRLVSLGIQSYARINKDYKPEVKYPKGFEEHIKNLDPEGGLLIVFPNGYGVSLLEADQGAGKTSVITCLREATGNISQPENAVNTVDNDKRWQLRFWGKDGKLYECRGTKATFVLEEIETENGEPKLNARGKEVKSEKKSPKEKMIELVGPAGVDPNTLKNMKGEDQINWIRSLFTLDTDALKLELENKAKREKAFKSRTEANTMHKQYSTLVTTSPEFILEKWNEHEEYFQKTNFDNVEEKIKDIQKKYTSYVEYEKGTEQLKLNKQGLEETIEINKKQILELEAMLQQAKEVLQKKEESKAAYETRIAEREKWLEENKDIKRQNDEIAEQVRDASEFKSKKQRFEQWKKNKEQMDHFSDESTRLTHIIDACDKWKKEFVRSFTPNVPNLEICIPDEDEKREGLFYHGKPSPYWSESEAWEVGPQIWEQLGTRIIYVENVSSLGSEAIKKLNEFAEKGGYIFGSQMNRAEKSLKITITNKLPD